jgi:hypothetical protein
MPTVTSTTKADHDRKFMEKKGLLEKEEKPSFEHDKKYHQKVAEISHIDVNDLKRQGAGEVHKLTEEQAQLHFGTKDFEKYLKEPISASVYSDGNVIIQDGHHRVAAAKLRGISHLPINLQAINARGHKLNELHKKSKEHQKLTKK